MESIKIHLLKINEQVLLFEFKFKLILFLGSCRWVSKMHLKQHIDFRSQLPAGLLIKICLFLFGMFHQLITLIHNFTLERHYSQKNKSVGTLKFCVLLRQMIHQLKFKAKEDKQKTLKKRYIKAMKPKKTRAKEQI